MSQTNTINLDECWLYAGWKDGQGYGVIGGRNEYGSHRGFRAHRVTYEQFVGQIPDGLVIDHLCRVRSCINPEHLEAVTCKVNTQRGIWSPRPPKTVCNHGHDYTGDNRMIDLKGRTKCRLCYEIKVEALREKRRRSRNH